MYDNSTIDMHYNKLQTDFKAEAVAVNLLKYHRSVSNIFIDRIEFEASDYLCRLKKNTSEFKAVHQRVFV